MKQDSTSIINDSIESNINNDVLHIFTNTNHNWILLAVSIFILVLGFLLEHKHTRKWLDKKIPSLHKNIFFSLSLSILVIAIGITLFMYSILRLNHFILDDSNTFIAIVISLLFGIFSFASFHVARKIEKNIRHAVDNFGDFSEYMVKVLNEKMKKEKYKMAVIYPYFGLLESVSKNLPNGFNDTISKLINKNKIEILMGNYEQRTNFLKQINDSPDKNKELFNRESQHKFALEYLVKGNKYLRENIKNHFDSNQDDFIKDGIRVNKDFFEKNELTIITRNNIKECYFDNPIHIVAAEKSMVWGTVDEAGFCTGFYSKDRDIVNAFKRLFDHFYKHK